MNTVFTANSDPEDESYNAFFDLLTDATAENVTAFFENITDMLGADDSIQELDDLGRRLHRYFHAFAAAYIRTATPDELECFLATCFQSQLTLERLNAKAENLMKTSGISEEDIMTELKERVQRKIIRQQEDTKHHA